MIRALKSKWQDFVVIGEPEALAAEAVGLSMKTVIALAILLGMVVMMLTGWVPTVMASVIAAVAMVLTGVMTMRQAYDSINWGVVVLIAALLPLGTALEKTGGVDLLVDFLIDTLGSLGPLWVMAGLFLLASVLSQIVSNVATAVLISPVALQAAVELGVDPTPYMMAVALAVTTGILTPVAGAPMLIVQTPGQYKFGDYVRVSLPLVGIIFVVVMILVPLIWPL
jgi:di/tricarboxylate transporter